jgi:hypothetical protein
MNKPIRLSEHAKLQSAERGVFENEIIETIRFGTKEPAKKNRLMAKQNFQYNDYWFKTFYAI